MMKTTICVFSALLISLSAGGQKFKLSLLKDINADTSYQGYQPMVLTVFKDKLFFSYNDKMGPYKMYVTQGSDSSTKLFCGDRFFGAGGYTPVNGLLFFTAEDSVHGGELWATNGTETGTYMVKDIFPGNKSSYAYSLKALGNVLYFVASNGSNGYELWRSDGTSQGTYMVKDIAIGSANSQIPVMAALDTKLVFQASDSSGNNAIYITDGSEAGTKKLSSPGGPFVFTNSDAIGAYKGILYFASFDSFGRDQLWQSDGTQAGTKLFRKINPNGNSFIGNFILFKGKLFFSASDEFNGNEIWYTDGTYNGTKMVTNVNPHYGYGPADLAEYNGRLYFTMDDGITGNEVWSTDSMPGSARLLKDINPNGSSIPLFKKVFMDKLFFITSMSTCDVWYTDGTESGTLELTKNVRKNVLNCMSDPRMVEYKGALYMPAFFDNRGAEIWKCEADNSQSVQGILSQDNIRIYPNPANETIHINCSTLIGAGHLTIIDVNGKIIRQLTLNSGDEMIDVSDMAIGFYVFSVQINGRYYRYKCTIQ